MKKLVLLVTLATMVVASPIMALKIEPPPRSTVQEADQKTPEVAPSTPQTPVIQTKPEKENPGKPGPRGSQGQQGPRGPQGPAGPSTNCHTHSASSYSVVAAMSPSSWRRVDDKIAKHVRDLHGKIQTSQVPVATAPAAIPNVTPHGLNWSWLWWLLAILALAAIIYFLLWPRIREWFGSRVLSCVNTAWGKYKRFALPNSRIRCHGSGSPSVQIQKAVKDLDSPKPSWQWAPIGGTLDFAHRPEARLRFMVSVVNSSTREIETTPSMVIHDLFRSKNYRPIPESGRVFDGNKEIGALNDRFVENMISGKEVRIANIIDRLPARNSAGPGRLNFVWDADDEEDDSVPNGGNIPEEEVVTEPEILLHPEQVHPVSPPVVIPAPPAGGDFDPEQAIENA